MRTKITLAVLAMLTAISAAAQTTSEGTVNATLINQSGIAIQFLSDASGVTLTGSGSNAAAADFGNISAYGTLSTGITRPATSSTSFTVRTRFGVSVTSSGVSTNSYNLQASLASSAPTGLSYGVDSVTLTVLPVVIQNNAAYSTTIAHNLDLIVSTAAPTAGGPAVGTVVSRTINFTAVAN